MLYADASATPQRAAVPECCDACYRRKRWPALQPIWVAADICSGYEGSVLRARLALCFETSLE